MDTVNVRYIVDDVDAAYDRLKDKGKPGAGTEASTDEAR